MNKMWIASGLGVFLILLCVLWGSFYPKQWEQMEERLRRRGIRVLNATGVLQVICAKIVPPQAAAAPDGPVRIWPIGDSITEGLPSYSSYRYWLWHLLRENASKVEFVGTKTGISETSPLHPDFDQRHNAYSGYRADDVFPLIAFAGRTVSFDIALIHLGTNDIAFRETPRETSRDLENLISVLRIRNPQATILLAEIIPVSGNERAFGELNRNLRKFAQRIRTETSAVITVDMNSGFDPKLLTYDGIHPTEAGEQFIAQRWFAALKPVLRPTS